MELKEACKATECNSCSVQESMTSLGTGRNVWCETMSAISLPFYPANPNCSYQYFMLHTCPSPHLFIILMYSKQVIQSCLHKSRHLTQPCTILLPSRNDGKKWQNSCDVSERSGWNSNSCTSKWFLLASIWKWLADGDWRGASKGELTMHSSGSTTMELTELAYKVKRN